MSTYVVQHPAIFEIDLAQKLGITLFNNAELTDKDIKHDPRKKIVLRNWWLWEGTNEQPEDLSWADLVICYTSELIKGPWYHYNQLTLQQFNNPNYICITNGLYNIRDYPQDRVYDKLGHFFSRIADVCYFDEWRSGHKTKLFDVLLGQTKPHRKFIYDQLCRHSLLDQSLVSIWGDVNYISPEIALIEDPALQTSRTTVSMASIAGLRNGVSMSHSIPTGIYQNTWYSIVAETNEHYSNFITEKTAKPLFEKRVFVLFGSQGLLARLRSFGFQTFDRVIDESYDREPNDQRRWKMAFDQVVTLANSDPIEVYSQVEQVLQNNYNIICDQTARLTNLASFLDQHTILL
jgi:hypothetical protein